MEYGLCANCGASMISSDRPGDMAKIHEYLHGDGWTLAELLAKYPNGFSVAPNGSISRIVMATPHIRAVALNFPTAPCGGGYLVVETIDE